MYPSHLLTLLCEWRMPNLVAVFVTQSTTPLYAKNIGTLAKGHDRSKAYPL